MLALWSPRHKFNTWRRVWLAVARAQHEVTKGHPVPLVGAAQVEALRRVVERPGGIADEEIRSAQEHERRLRHDVMAHVHALGEACPEARGIIHLGMTSQDVVCNADLLILRDAINLTGLKLVRAIVALGDLARRTARLPTLGFTHYQPAQPVTVGRRAASWALDLLLCRPRLAGLGAALALRGLKGATGTQASFLALFEGDAGLVEALERSVSRELAGNAAHETLPLSNQTYPRVIDTFILADLASVAAALHKIATDIRLLSNRKELDEPFEDEQIGSSAMPYKRNPMRCERICGLCRFVMNLAGNAADTAATQWLERTLDDSSNRRLSLPEAFLALDGALDLAHNVASGLVVHEAMVRRNLLAELPFMATENILMACVRRGGDRQHYHGLIRVHAQAAGLRVKQHGLDNDLLDRLRNDPSFRAKDRGGPLSGEPDWDNLLDPMKYVGLSVEQTERFVRESVDPLREEFGRAIAALGESAPGV
jgi:adenylosuccinate lyase